VEDNQQLQPTTPKNSQKQKFNPKNKPQAKNPIGKPTTTKRATSPES
jgi:hypothetical protein